MTPVVLVPGPLHQAREVLGRAVRERHGRFWLWRDGWRPATPRQVIAAAIQADERRWRRAALARAREVLRGRLVVHWGVHGRLLRLDGRQASLARVVEVAVQIDAGGWPVAPMAPDYPGMTS